MNVPAAYYVITDDEGNAWTDTVCQDRAERVATALRNEGHGGFIVTDVMSRQVVFSIH